MRLRQIKSLICTSVIALTTLLAGCASQGIQMADGSQATNPTIAFKSGQARLMCDTLSCAGAWGQTRKASKAYYEQRLWSDLAREVMRVGYQSNLTYFYLGRAAEALGHTAAAKTYYKLGLTRVHQCASLLINTCDGFDVPRELMAGSSRLSADPVTEATQPPTAPAISVQAASLAPKSPAATPAPQTIAASTIKVKSDDLEKVTSNTGPTSSEGSLLSPRKPDNGFAFHQTATAAPLDNLGLSRLIQKNKNLEINKGQFETLDQLRKRLGHLERGVEVTFTPTKGANKRDISYDHASQRLTVRLVSSNSKRRVVMFDDPVEIDINGSRKEDPSRAVLPLNQFARPMYSYFIVDVKPRTTRKYQGSNAFGATATVTAHAREQYGFIVLNMMSDQLDKIQVELDVPPQIAEQLAGQLVWRFRGTTSIGQWETPRAVSSPEWAFRDYYLKEATIDWPTDYQTTNYLAPMLVNNIELINQTTGEVKRNFVVRQ